VQAEVRRNVLKGGLGAALGLVVPAFAGAEIRFPAQKALVDFELGPGGLGNPTEINGKMLDKSSECKVCKLAKKFTYINMYVRSKCARVHTHA